MVHADAARARGTNTRRSRSLVGGCYLNGHTITIRTNKDDIVHGLVEHRSNEGGNGFDHIYVNGEHFWNRE